MPIKGIAVYCSACGSCASDFEPLVWKRLSIPRAITSISGSKWVDDTGDLVLSVVKRAVGDLVRSVHHDGLYMDSLGTVPRGDSGVDRVIEAPVVRVGEGKESISEDRKIRPGIRGESKRRDYTMPSRHGYRCR